tara:strand:- start:14407 stop:14568 length:162 start_codon:yes stop_codon:yes gene_type:complete
MNFAQRLIKRILGMIGKKPLIIAKGLNIIAEITIPRKNNSDLSQIALGAVWER